MGDASAFGHNSCGELQPRDLAVAQLASRQQGRVSSDQLHRLGHTRREVSYRVQVGRLHVVQRGVYAVGHMAAPPLAPQMTAVLASGPGAVLSHRSAAALWEIRAWSGLVEVTVPRRLRPRPGMRRHFAILPADEVTRLHDVPVTSPVRTVLDLAIVLRDDAELKRAVEQLYALAIPGPLSLDALLARYPRRKGTARIRNLGAIEPRLTRKELEALFNIFLDEEDLPPPETNVWLAVDGEMKEVDGLWRDRRLIVELDGYDTHKGKFHADRSRDLAFWAEGYVVIRVTWRMLHDDRAALARRLRKGLTSSG